MSELDKLRVYFLIFCQSTTVFNKLIWTDIGTQLEYFEKKKFLLLISNRDPNKQKHRGAYQNLQAMDVEN